MAESSPNLASRSFAPWLADLIGTGYQFHLVFLWLPAPEMAVARVAARVRDGGHDVPEATIRRRYEAGLRNFFRLYRPMARTWEFWDNSSGISLRPIAFGVEHSTLTIGDPVVWESIVAGYDR